MPRSAEDGWTGDLSGAPKTSSAGSGQQSGDGVGGLRWAKALTLAEGLLDREEEGGLVDRLPLRARFLGGRGDKEAGGSSFFWSCFEEVVEAGVVCADVGNGMTLISLLGIVDFVLGFVFFTCGEDTATNRPSWVLSTCITFSGLQAET